MIDDISNRLSSLRKDMREYFGGITWEPVTKQFGIYKMNIPEKEAFLSYAEHHFVELEKMLQAYQEQSYKQSEK